MQSVRYGSHTLREFAGFPELRYLDREHLPSWTVCGQGWCEVSIVLYAQGLHIHITEASERNGRTTTKETMETLDDAATRALYGMLKARYEPEVPNV